MLQKMKLWAPIACDVAFCSLWSVFHHCSIWCLQNTRSKQSWGYDRSQGGTLPTNQEHLYWTVTWVRIKILLFGRLHYCSQLSDASIALVVLGGKSPWKKILLPAHSYWAWPYDLLWLVECEQKRHRLHLSRSFKSYGMTLPLLFFPSWEQQALGRRCFFSLEAFSLDPRWRRRMEQSCS